MLRRTRPHPGRMKNWIRAGDIVQIMRGDERGTRENPRRAKVLKVLPEEGRLIVEGVNKVYKHVRKSQQHPRGGRIEKEAPIAVANVALVCPSCGAPSRRKIRVREDGNKERICSHCGAVIPLPT